MVEQVLLEEEDAVVDWVVLGEAAVSFPYSRQWLRTAVARRASVVALAPDAFADVDAASELAASAAVEDALEPVAGPEPRQLSVALSGMLAVLAVMPSNTRRNKTLKLKN